MSTVEYRNDWNKASLKEIVEQLDFCGFACEAGTLTTNGAYMELKLRAELPKPRVITLCGSTKFKEEYERANEILTLAGNIVISVGLFGHRREVTLMTEQKTMLDEIHLRKIDLADEIVVINVNGYVGESTRREIAYAREHGKTIRYLCPPDGADGVPELYEDAIPKELEQ